MDASECRLYKYTMCSPECLYLILHKQLVRQIRAMIYISDRVNLLSVGESQKIPCYELAQIVFS